MLDEGKVVEWHRVQAYQDVSLKLILQEILQGLARERANDRVYLRREVDREPLRPMLSLPKGEFHLFLSHYNAGATTFMKLLQEYHMSKILSSLRSGNTRRSRASSQRSFLSRRTDHVSIKFTSDPKQMMHAQHFLCYLNADTHTSGVMTKKFHAHLELALRMGMHILLVHETRNEASGAPFKTIIDATPEALKWDTSGDVAMKRLYKELAVMICGSVCKEGTAHLNVGLHLVSNAISYTPANMLDRTDVDLEELDVGIDVDELSLGPMLEGVDEEDSYMLDETTIIDEESAVQHSPGFDGARRPSQLPRGAARRPSQSPQVSALHLDHRDEQAAARRLTLKLDHRRASSHRCAKEGPGRMRVAHDTSTRSVRTSFDDEPPKVLSDDSQRPSQLLLGTARRPSQLTPGARRPSQLSRGSVMFQLQSVEKESAKAGATPPGKLKRQGTGRRLTLKLDQRRGSTQAGVKEGPGRERSKERTERSKEGAGMWRSLGLAVTSFLPSASVAQKSENSEEPAALAQRTRRSSCREEAMQRRMSTAVSRPERVLRTCARLPGVKLCADAGLQAGRVVQSGLDTVLNTGVNVVGGLREVVAGGSNASSAALTQELEAVETAAGLKVEGLEATIKELQAQLAAKDRALQARSGAPTSEANTMPSVTDGSPAAAHLNVSTPTVQATQDGAARSTRRKPSILITISEEPRKRSVVALPTPSTLPWPVTATIPTPSTGAASTPEAIDHGASSGTPMEISRNRRLSRASPQLPEVAPLPQPSRRCSLPGTEAAAPASHLPEVAPLPQPSRKQSISAGGDLNAAGIATSLVRRTSAVPCKPITPTAASTRNVGRPQMRNVGGQPQQTPARGRVQPAHGRVQHV